MAARIAMMPITTSSSIRVKAGYPRRQRMSSSFLLSPRAEHFICPAGSISLLREIPIEYLPHPTDIQPWLPPTLDHVRSVRQDGAQNRGPYRLLSYCPPRRKEVGSR